MAHLLVHNYRVVAIRQHYSVRDERCSFCRPSWLGTEFDEMPGVFFDVSDMMVSFPRTNHWYDRNWKSRRSCDRGDKLVRLIPGRSPTHHEGFCLTHPYYSVICHTKPARGRVAPTDTMLLLFDELWNDSGKTFDVVDPARENIIGTCPEMCILRHHYSTEGSNQLLRSEKKPPTYCSSSKNGDSQALV
jgi:hypothetical protein